MVSMIALCKTSVLSPKSIERQRVGLDMSTGAGGLNEKGGRNSAAEGITRLRRKVEKDAAARAWPATHPRKDLIDDPYGD